MSFTNSATATLRSVFSIARWMKRSGKRPVEVESPTRSRAAAFEDEIGTLYRESVESGSAVLTVSTIEGDETDVTKVMYAAGAIKVNSYRDETGWME